MTAPIQVNPGVRQVLTAPRGHRFTRTRTDSRPPTREQVLLAQMAGNPRVQHRLQHGELPHWMKVAAQQRTRRATPTVPRPRPAPDDGPRPQPPPLPRRPRSHRKPRRTPWRLIGYTLATTAGALAHYLVTTLV